MSFKNKRKLVFIIILVLIQFLISAQITFVSAGNSFRLGFDGELTCNAGEQVNVPIVIDNIDMSDSIQRGVVSFSCTLDISDQMFELVGTEINESIEYIHIYDEIKPYVKRCLFNASTNKLIMVIELKDENDEELYINEYTKLGYVTLKVKEGTKTGRYSVGAYEIEGGNTERNVDAYGKFATVYVNGVNASDDEEPEYTSDTRNLGTTKSVAEKELEVSYVKSSDGRKLSIYVDSINGVTVSKVVIDGVELTKVNNHFEADVEPGNTYKIVFYDGNGKMIAIRTVSIDSIDDEIDAEKSGNGYKYTSYKPSFEEQTEDKEKSVVEKILTGDRVSRWGTYVVIASIVMVSMVIVRKKIYG